jgi:uncharacterized protein
MQTILITGGTGLVGTELTKVLLQSGYSVIILTRNASKATAIANLKYAYWDIDNNKIDIAALQQADAIIHLAGAGVMDKPWTKAYKKTIEDSRVKSSLLIVNTLKTITHKVKTIVSSSAIGWYGKDVLPNHYFTENEPASADYLGEVCKKWEDSIDAASQMGIRVCKLRTGIVLSNKGAAYVEFKKTMPFKIASVLGNGKQIVSWIHIDDLCRQFIFALQQNIAGSYNAVAPTPVSNSTLVKAIAKKVCGSFYLTVPVPNFVLKIILGERSIEILKSATVSCKKIIDAGFVYKFATIEAAVNDLEA